MGGGGGRGGYWGGQAMAGPRADRQLSAEASKGQGVTRPHPIEGR